MRRGELRLRGRSAGARPSNAVRGLTLETGYQLLAPTSDGLVVEPCNLGEQASSPVPQPFCLQGDYLTTLSLIQVRQQEA